MKSKIRVRASEHRPQRRRADAPPAPAGSPGRCPSPAVRASRARPLRPAPAVLLAWAARPLASSCLSFGVVYKAMFVLTSGDVAVQTRADGRRAGRAAGCWPPACSRQSTPRASERSEPARTNACLRAPGEPYRVC